ncbi:hypothetical protein HU200_056350 [Digitaria exilis]|uniref:Uncharacterized protein n=1 Tax=Digitaria exilis TaxID=1010633 RepID=A0A835E547_9POAL|nr:hypothetical protein HU200_056350 [Digitaria exilis]
MATVSVLSFLLPPIGGSKSVFLPKLLFWPDLRCDVASLAHSQTGQHLALCKAILAISEGQGLSMPHPKAAHCNSIERSVINKKLSSRVLAIAVLCGLRSSNFASPEVEWLPQWSLSCLPFGGSVRPPRNGSSIDSAPYTAPGAREPSCHPPTPCSSPGLVLGKLEQQPAIRLPAPSVPGFKFNANATPLDHTANQTADMRHRPLLFLSRVRMVPPLLH